MKSIAIVGVSCRFPGGVADTEQLWSLLVDGRDVISEVPASRFDLNALYSSEPAPGRVACRYGGFIDEVWEFDPAFFNISPRDAAVIDPQQRLLLQTSWEALEDAGIPPSRLRQSATGVFIGLHLNEYSRRSGAGLDLTGLTGSARNAAAGRVSYALDLMGPAMAVDTDRSSGLVALHCACSAIWSDECESAIVGAANLILSPDVSVAFSAAGMLSPDGRCKFGDASANGFVRSEGVAAIVVRPLELALRDGNPIYAVIRGTSVQASGQLSGDLMTPSPAAQSRLIRHACERAQVKPSELIYVEAHGTGTPVGDRVELTALAEVVGTGRQSNPCLVGSIKSNIGHAEACAGLAGLLKVALAANHRAIPASLHFKNFPTELSGRNLGLRIPTALTKVPDGVEFLAGVSSFGLTGINAHAIVSGPPVRSRPTSAQSAPISVLCLSARHFAGLRKLAGDYAATVKDTAISMVDVCQTAAIRRDHLSYRAVFVGRTREEIVTSLTSFAQGTQPDTAFILGRVKDHKPKVAFVFPGQGSQWAGMGRTLLKENRAFAEKMAECDHAIRMIAGWSPLAELSGEPRLGRIDVVQPLLVAVEISLAAMWQSWGVQPDAVIGTSMGEVAAAYISGGLNIDDAFKVICDRSRLMGSAVGHGAMAVIEQPAQKVMARLDLSKVSIAAVNSPSSTVISGERVAVEAAVKSFEAENVFAQLVRVDVGSHSAQMDAILEPLSAALRELRPADNDVPFYSTVHSGLVAGSALRAEYWVKNLRAKVAFSDTLQQLLKDGHEVFIEMSPHPVLLSSVLDGIAYQGKEALVFGTLKRNQDELCTALESLAALHTYGYPIDWARVLPEGQFTRLPKSPWCNATYQIDSTETIPPASVPADQPVFGNATMPPANLGSMSPAGSTTPISTPLLDRLNVAPAEAWVPILTDVLQKGLARLLKLPIEAVELERPFRELGLTSLAATEFRIYLGTLFGQTYPVALLFNHPNIKALATHLCSELGLRRGFLSPQRWQSARVTPRGEPIAIIGIAIRFPGGIRTTNDLCDVLQKGGNVITEIPPDRWDAARLFDANMRTPGKMHTRWGGFVRDIGDFDPEFFGIAPREAEGMDPQQRLLLELSREAFENAGLPRSEVAGSATGVFIGMMNTNEYARRKMTDIRLDAITPHTSTGDAMSVAAGRLSYFFDLHGPAVTIDTACSSSLVALHLASNSLRLGECRVAIAGGVNLIASPAVTLAFAKTRMLSPRGQCRTFDAGADGYVRSEGGCVLVLKCLSDAIADRDNVIALVRGSAVNQDGRTSGMTAPNGVAQKAVIERALDNASVAASDVTYVEAHGTGTPLGDPIEVQAIVEAFSDSHRADNPLIMGAVKANLGHLESCAGLAGVAKVLVSMKNREIPRQINLERINPNIHLPDWLIIPRDRRPWEPEGKKRIAGVSSFGFSGTNAHVILEEADANRGDIAASRAPAIICVSSNSADGLKKMAQRLVEHIDSLDPASLYDVAYSSAVRREHFPYREAFILGNPAETREHLLAVAEGKTVARFLRTTAKPTAAKIAFLYTGQGSEYLGMGQGLYEHEPQFRAAFDRCADLIALELDTPLSMSLFGAQPELIKQLRYLQSALFALQYALTEMWASWGIKPTVVLGHGLGEYAAACAAGILELKDAIRLIARQSEVLDGLVTPSAAAMVQAHPEQASAEVIHFCKPRITFVSTLTGQPIGDEVCNAGYFSRLIREPGRFGEGILSIAKMCNVFLEVGPSHTLLRLGQEAVTDSSYLWAPSLSKEQPDPIQVCETLTRLYAAGASVNWKRFYLENERRYHPLPPHLFAHRKFWIGEEVTATPAQAHPSSIE